jgi:hypothetical protein
VIKGLATLLGLLHSFRKCGHDLVDIPKPVTLPPFAQHTHAKGRLPGSVNMAMRQLIVMYQRRPPRAGSVGRKGPNMDYDVLALFSGVEGYQLAEWVV